MCLDDGKNWIRENPLCPLHNCRNLIPGVVSEIVGDGVRRALTLETLYRRKSTAKDIICGLDIWQQDYRPGVIRLNIGES